MPADPKPRLEESTDPKLLQLKQYLHRPGCIATAAHPLVKQMARSQPTSPLPGHPIQDLPRVMLAGFRVMSSLGVISLIKPLELILGRPVKPPCPGRQTAPMLGISRQSAETLAPLPPGKAIFDKHTDNSN